MMNFEKKVIPWLIKRKSLKNMQAKWKAKTIFKDSFYKFHKNEIDKYKRASTILEKITGTSAIKSKEWQKEIQNLESEIEILNKKSKYIKEEYESINYIKYAVKTVNDEYGIDLSIEIDKAIKRGEKPSFIAQLKKFQEQQEKAEQYHNKVKEKYGGEERQDIFYYKNNKVVEFVIWKKSRIYDTKIMI